MAPLNERERHERWIFGSHSRAELREWATSLKFFRFCRAIGGHANDGDTLRAALRFGSGEELHALCAQLGFALTPLPPDEPQPVRGRTYAYEEFRKFRSPIEQHPLWEQPGRRQVAGVEISLWVSAHKLELTLSGAAGDYYEVTELDVENAKRVELALSPVAAQVVDPPQDGDYCICPQQYPGFWQSAEIG